MKGAANIIAEIVAGVVLGSLGTVFCVVIGGGELIAAATRLLERKIA